MQSTTKLIAIAAAASLGMASQAAWAADNASASATVTLVMPIQVSKTSDLAFGQVAIPSAGATATTVAISTGGVQSGSSNFVSTQSVSAAQFAITGQGTFAYTPTVTVTDAGLTGLALSAFSGECSGGSPQSIALATPTGLTGCGLTAGADTLTVGGTLTIDSTATSGAKTPGSIAVVVAYN